MSASANVIFNEIFFGALSTIFNLLKVIVPLMIIIELLMVYHVVEKLATKLEGMGKIMGMSKNAILPLLVGLIMGVSYGAGTLIEINSHTPLSKKDFALVGVFMFCCHGIIETAFLFGMAGASIWFVTIVRLLIAFVVTIIAARLPVFRKMDLDLDAGLELELASKLKSE